MHRRFGRILEDVGTLPMARLLPARGWVDSVEYFITNPGPNTPVVPIDGFDISFEDAIHDYDAVELTADKRFGNNWGLQTSYRWSRLHGTFEGFFRNDNGQSDPAITSLFDFPTNDPSYTAIGVPEFGFRGDIRYLGALGAGPLPTDRPHQFKVYGNYSMNWGLNLGAGVQLSSGSPLTPLAANPVYENNGEIPEGPRGSGIETVDGFKTRTPFTYEVNLHADYGVRMGGARRVVLLADVFNLFNAQRATGYDQDTESTFGALNPDFGQPVISPDPAVPDAVPDPVRRAVRVLARSAGPCDPQSDTRREAVPAASRPARQSRFAGSFRVPRRAAPSALRRMAGSTKWSDHSAVRHASARDQWTDRGDQPTFNCLDTDPSRTSEPRLHLQLTTTLKPFVTAAWHFIPAWHKASL